MKRPAHALLLTGEEGVGLGTVARRLAESVGAKAQLLLIVPDEKGTIPIEVIHELYQQTRSRRNDEKLAVLIDDAESMSRPAQNALLKLLEEPVEGVHFILTTHHLERILSTILSRLAKLRIRMVDRASSETVLDRYGTDLPAQKRQQMLFIASGRPAYLRRLLDDDDLFEQQAVVVRDARTMLGNDTYEKVRLAYRYDKNRQQALRLVSMMFNLLKYTAFEQGSSEAVLSSAKLEEAANALEHNGHIRTHLMSLALR